MLVYSGLFVFVCSLFHVGFCCFLGNHSKLPANIHRLLKSIVSFFFFKWSCIEELDGRDDIIIEFVGVIMAGRVRDWKVIESRDFFTGLNLNVIKI